MATSRRDAESRRRRASTRCAFLREGDVAIDIGAHTGDLTLPIALAVGARGLVFALEPNPYVFKVGGKRDAESGEGTRVPLMFAAMPADGQFEFEYSDSGYCNGGFHDGIARWRHGHFDRLRVEGRNLAEHLRRHAPTSCRASATSRSTPKGSIVRSCSRWST